MLFPEIPPQLRAVFPDWFWDWFRKLKAYITQEFTTSGNVTLLTADAGIILVSPNGTVYKVTVDNTGALVVTPV